MDSKEQILVKLREERLELINMGRMSPEIVGRIEDIDEQILEIEGEDTFRSFELEDNGAFISEDEFLFDVEDEGFGDDNYGFISTSFHDPSKDY
jgi:hypothetical protein